MREDCSERTGVSGVAMANGLHGSWVR